jgi:protein-S-isoprenylcysteine O-methyltransferase Ste14
MTSIYLYGLTALGLIFPVLALLYISQVRSIFAAVPKLERPWLLLEIGVILLLASLVTAAISNTLSSASNVLRPLGNLLLVLTSFFILYAMITMKRVWTISESD